MEQQPQPQEGAQATEQQEQRFKTLGVRLDEELHAQLSFIAQLEGSTITEEIRRSIEARVTAAQDDPDLVARAEEARARIDREAQARSQAIAGFFGKVAVTGATSDTSSEGEPSGRRGRPGGRTARNSGDPTTERP